MDRKSRTLTGDRGASASDAGEIQRLFDVALRHARRTLAGWPRVRERCSPEDLVQAAFEKLLAAGHRPAPHIGLLKSTIHHLAVDMDRRRMPRPEEAAEEWAADPSPSPLEQKEAAAQRAEEITSALQRRFGRLRSELDDLVQAHPPPESGVDYPALLLFHLRASVVRRLGDWDGPPPHGEIAERHIPWRGHEGERSFRGEWPSIEPLWSACRPLADRPPHRIVPEEINAAAGELTGGRASATDAQHYMWKKRAKKLAESHAGSETYDEVFRPILDPANKHKGKPA